MEIIVIRHGQTLENIQSLCQGQSDGTLSEQGVVQAEQLRLKLDLSMFDVVISSDLARASHTAEIIFGSLHEIMRDKRLRERDLKALQGSRFDHDRDYCVDIEGCESMAQMRARLEEFLGEIKLKYSTQRVVLVTHGLSIRVIESICNNVDVALTSLVDNCSLNKFIIP